MRVKEQLQKEQEKEDALDWLFAEWLDYFSKEPTGKELDEMERESLDKRDFYYPINNLNYQPLQGK